MASFSIGGVIALRRQRAQYRGFLGKAFCYYFLDGAVHALVGFFPQPLFGQLVQMRPTLKLTIALEEVMLDVAYHPFTFALGPCSIGTAGSGRESIVVAQVQKAFVEAHHHPAPDVPARLTSDCLPALLLSYRPSTQGCG